MCADSCFWRCFSCVVCLLLFHALCQPGFVGTTSMGRGNHMTCSNFSDPICGNVFVDDKPCGDNFCRCCGRSGPDHQPYYAECFHHNNLKYIPQLPHSIRYLSFTDNLLTAIPLTEHFFSNVTQITDLLLMWDNISHIEQYAFRALRNLTCVVVTANYHLTWESIIVIMSIPGLQYLSLEQCRLSSPPKDLFSNMTSDVVELKMTATAAADHTSCLYDLTAYSALHKLRSIMLNFCDICAVKTNTVVHINYLNLDQNCMDRLPQSCAANKMSLFPNLSSLKITNNHLLYLKEACLPSLRFLDLSKNPVVLSSFRITNYPGLKTLWMNKMVTTRMTLASNLFSHPTLEELQLEFDYIAFGSEEIVPSNVFANCPRLTRLSLVQNNFENVDDVRFLVLLGHLSLEVLKLSGNKLTSFPLSTLTNFSNLSRLELNGAGISSIPDGAFDLLRNLSWLSLTLNDITTITEQTFSVETRERLNVLYLDINPFTCTCELMWFRNWFVSDMELFHHTRYPSALDTIEYKCNNLPLTSLANFSMVEQACLMSHDMNVMIVFICSVVIVTLTIVSLVFRFRWHIRLALYEVFRGRGDVRRLRLLADHFDYDVFVSYDKEDLPWVYQRLMPELETRLGLRLCVHERDFIPGNNIVDNIVECVQSSKKILMVFSKDFVRSQWCQFELTFCMNHAMNYDDVLLIVCVDDVASRDMTAAMMAVLRTTTYIQWEELDDAVDSFWGRLRLALHEIIPPPDAALP
ncbi:toll-like receptor 13 [Littorina saxatilis]|uniref:toll-like receptor 13 n=1 Tax=Littorina saxatilis TaxID=31220 RepID=UPI0038B5A8BC